MISYTITIVIACGFADLQDVWRGAIGSLGWVGLHASAWNWSTDGAGKPATIQLGGSLFAHLFAPLVRNADQQLTSLGNGSDNEVSTIQTTGPCHIDTMERGRSKAGVQATSIVPMLSMIPFGSVSAMRVLAECAITTLKPLQLGINSSSG